jgi:hypothetical protein
MTLGAVSTVAKRRSETQQPPQGEQDLGLKLAMRRVFWVMNYATRLNLLLALPGTRRTADELSDLDCVGFSVGGDFSVRLLIADCKSGARVSPASRLFWLAGVRDFFGADRAYAVLQRSVPDGVREQAARLGLDVLGEEDRQILENVHGAHASAGPMFDLAGAVKLQELAKGLDRRLEALVRFRDHEYERHRFERSPTDPLNPRMLPKDVRLPSTRQRLNGALTTAVGASRAASTAALTCARTNRTCRPSLTRGRVPRRPRLNRLRVVPTGAAHLGSILRAP